MSRWYYLLYCFTLSIHKICSVDVLRLMKNDVEFLNSLITYEIVQPILSKEMLFNPLTKLNEKGHILSFYLSRRHIRLELFQNRNLFSVNFFERYFTANDIIKTKKNIHHCFYHGYNVLGESAVAAISTCNGTDGYFTISNTTYIIQPIISLLGERKHIVFQPQHVKNTNYKCGHAKSQTYEILHEVTEQSHRFRRDVLTETKYLEMAIVNDKSQFTAHGGGTALRSKKFANIIDSVYRIHNLRVVLILVEVWEANDKIMITSDDQVTMDNFKKYKKDTLDMDRDTRNDHAQLITKMAFASGVLGKAPTLSICSPSSVAVIRDHSSNDFLVASTMAHELGHNFGFSHDEDITDETCVCGNSTACLMAARLGSTPLLELSSCSTNTLRKTLLDNYGTCLFDEPTKHARDTECGNGFIEEGEQCDCGPKEHCELIGNTCCNYTTCHLYVESECSDGPCCDKCKLKSRGVLCRGAVNDCDLPEYCDGKSALCAPDSFVHNGRPCEKDGAQSLCYLGVCHTHTSQCKNFWGPSSSKAHTYCYRYVNIKGNQWGHCKKFSDGSFMKCSVANSQCGKLQCQNVPSSKLPVIGTDRKSHNIKVGPYTCWSGSVYMGDDIPEPGIIQDGTTCGDNKVCFNNTCIDINAAYEQPKCPSNCSGNGICNNLGHCHCNNGFKCPDCKEACVGIGGSVDSGIGCDCFDPNSTVSPTTATNIPTTLAPMTNATENATIEPSTEHTITKHSKNTTIVPVTILPTTIVSTTKMDETTSESGDNNTSDEDPGRKSFESASIVAVAVVVPLLIVIIAILIFCFREQIRTKIRKMREPQQKPFTTVSYVEDHNRRASSSSQANLTEVSPSRPTKLDIGGPIKNDITITPDRSSNVSVSTPRGQTSKRPITPLTPTLRPARPVPPQRPLGQRNRSLPDLLETQPSFKRPAVPSKAQSFNVADKPSRPRPPPMRTATEKANRADVKVPKRPPSFRTGAKPNTPSDPFNRSALRNTAGSDSNQLPATNNQSRSAPSFKPSDIKAGKSPFTSPKV